MPEGPSNANVDAGQIPAPPSRPDKWCLSCSYPLIGLSEDRCPECGRAFDSRNVSTFKSHRLSERDRRLLAAPPLNTDLGRVITSLLFVPPALLLPGGLLLGVVGLALAFVFLPLRALRRMEILALGKRHNVPVNPDPHRRGVAVFCVVMILTAWTSWPGLLLCWLHRPALQAFCHQIYEVDPHYLNASGTRRIGMLFVSYSKSPTGVRLRFPLTVDGWYGPKDPLDERSELTLTKRPFFGTHDILWPFEPR
jgi:hypothetical protein